MTNRSKKYFHDKNNDYSKGIFHSLREQQPVTSISTYRNIEDISEWKKQIDEAAIKPRMYTVLRLG